MCLVKMMNARDPDRPPLIFIMNTLMMTVGELSAEFMRIAGDTSHLSFVPHSESVFTSDEYDVAVSSTDSGVSIAISEPACGQPILSQHADVQGTACQQARWLIEAMNARRDMLNRVMDVLSHQCPDFPIVKHAVRFNDLANACDVHITIVAKAIHNKQCLTPCGPVPCVDYIYNLR